MGHRICIFKMLMLMLLGGDHTSRTPISQERMADQALPQRVIRTAYGPQPFSIPRGGQALWPILFKPRNRTKPALLSPFTVADCEPGTWDGRTWPLTPYTLMESLTNSMIPFI